MLFVVFIVDRVDKVLLGQRTPSLEILKGATATAFLYFRFFMIELGCSQKARSEAQILQVAAAPNVRRCRVKVKRVKAWWPGGRFKAAVWVNS